MSSVEHENLGINFHKKNQNSTSLDRFLKEIDKTKSLSHKEELALAQEHTHESFTKLVEANLKFVVFIAKEYQHRGLPMEELVAEGNVGLLEAAKRFNANHKKGVKFISYAVWWVKQSILRAIYKQDMVQNPINHVLANLKLNNLNIDFVALDHLDPNKRAKEIAKIAAKYRVNPRHLQVSRRQQKPISLNDPPRSRGDSRQFIEELADENSPLPDANLAQIEEIRSLMEFIKEKLTQKEFEVIRLYFGIDQERPLTLEEIGEKYKLTRERIRQIKEKALRKLQRAKRDFFELY